MFVSRFDNEKSDLENEIFVTLLSFEVIVAPSKSTSIGLFPISLNSPALIFEMAPFILLLTIQLFFIKLFENKEIDIFKYSGLKNSKIIIILSFLSIFTGIMVVSVFYSLSSNFKNIYLELKSNYISDGKYLAVITKNGLWIKDKINNKIIITNSSIVEGKYLIKILLQSLMSFNVIRNIQSDKIDISNTNWIIQDAKIYLKNDIM